MLLDLPRFIREMQVVEISRDSRDKRERCHVHLDVPQMEFLLQARYFLQRDNFLEFTSLSERIANAMNLTIEK